MKGNTSKHYCMLQVIFVGIALIVVFQTFVDNRSRDSNQLFDIIIISSIIFFTYCVLLSILSMNPIIWLIDFMFSQTERVSFIYICPCSSLIIGKYQFYSKVNLMTNWAMVLAIALIFTTIYTIKVKSKANTITRKVFHIFISIVYMIGIKSDIIFLSFSSAAILAIFVMIEVRLPFLSLYI